MDSSQAEDQEARLLVKLLRTSRLALLYGDAGSDRTALLKSGLMPLLQRRASDRLAAAQAATPGAPPLSERRQRTASGTPKFRREFVVYFDDWTDTPLAALHSAIYRAAATGPADRAAPLARLTELLEFLSKRHDADLIILLDRFEEFLRASSQRIDIIHFANELVEAINQVHLPANFLISVSEESRPLMARFGSRIPGFDDFSLKLTQRPGSTAAVAAQPSQEPSAPSTTQPAPVSIEALPPPTATPATDQCPPAAAGVPRTGKLKVKRHPLPKPATKTEDVYAMIEAQLTRLASGESGELSVRTGPVDPDPSPTKSNLDSTLRSRPGVTQLPLEAVQSDESGTDAPPPRAALPQPPEQTEPPAPRRRRSLQGAVEWIDRHLHLTIKPRHRGGR